jgi:hypothetical protein
VRSNAWWTSLLFGVGSMLFALGALPGYAAQVGTKTDALTFFMGSIFFTTAAYLQFTGAAEPDGALPRVRPRSWWPRTASARSGAIQLAGTLWFNITTFAALSSNLSIAQQDRWVWRPDALGSICFLVASAIALGVVSSGSGWWRPAGRAWKAAALNMVGSVAFGVSAVASYVVKDSGSVRNAKLVNLGTFVGAVCFLVAAIGSRPRDRQPS